MYKKRSSAHKNQAESVIINKNGWEENNQMKCDVNHIKQKSERDTSRS